MDETYIKIRGRWKYLYRAVDSNGQTIDVLLTAKRDAAAALCFFRKAIRHHSEPEVVTIDKSGANTAALAILNGDKAEDETITVRQSKYLNNLIEQDHRNIKRRIRLMPGFKSFRRAQTILEILLNAVIETCVKVSGEVRREKIKNHYPNLWA